MEGKPREDNIYTSDRLGRLHMVSESITVRCEALIGLGLDPLHSRRVLKTVRLMTIRNGPKQTISVSGVLGLLQMVLEADVGRCTSEDASPQGGWIVRSHID